MSRSSGSRGCICGGGGGGSGGGGGGGTGVVIAGSRILGAVSADVPSLTATIASFPSGVQWSTVRGSAIAANVAQLPAGIALHSLSLAIPSVVARSTALVASSRSWCRRVPSNAVASVEPTALEPLVSRAVTGEMARLAARVTSAACSSTVDTKSWAVRLNVTESLAMVALLGLSSSWVWASVRLVSRLLAVITEPLCRGADFSEMPNGPAFVACFSR